MDTRTRRLASVVGLVGGGACLLAGCGSSSAGAATAPSTASAAAGPSAAATGATPVAVSEKEFSITLSQKSFTPGTYTFKVANQGTIPHNLTIQGPGVDKKATATLPPGRSGSVTVTLTAGSYELWCSVDSHKERGMDTKITVS